MSSKPVILDSSALIAEINLADSLHEKAQAINDVLSRTDRQVILPYEVFAEAINIFGKKVGRQEATSAGKALLSTSKRYLKNAAPLLRLDSLAKLRQGVLSAMSLPGAVELQG